MYAAGHVVRICGPERQATFIRLMMCLSRVGVGVTPNDTGDHVASFLR
jgi:hypothetical protein